MIYEYFKLVCITCKKAGGDPPSEIIVSKNKGDHWVIRQAWIDSIEDFIANHDNSGDSGCEIVGVFEA